MITLQAYAKINLSLDVVGRLENGYHLVRMIMQTIGICDELSFERTDGEIRITANDGDLPLGEDNLIYRAAVMIRDRFHTGGVSVHLEKRIPVAAGMAGGSTDAACTLKAMNQLYDLRLSEEELRELGVKLGADVPYCIMGGTALSEGIGEVLTPIAPMPDCFLLVAKPEINVSTKYVYEQLDSHEIPLHPDVDGMRRAIEEKDIRGMARLLGNVLQMVTVERYPIVEELKQVMLEQGALGSLMSGSGPSTFGIFDDEEKAKAAAERIKALGLAKQVFVTRPVDIR
ncbi:MAG: 4-(cytidine 5'-diphospho)-2-C-methyl-D-erythritol kinase [Lachnospiraceae bacterium]|nr:4-(cytidine 5'-diphospho)-2-C-methyl-D-erythritol kinase [Lachnospiraceae bacterium]MBR4608428.1 4-(cytidine 5'-diphospho)-2-C-methyl-D-erythritol kinase [Lachnospiraceae bacterium]